MNISGGDGGGCWPPDEVLDGVGVGRTVVGVRGW